MHRKQVLLSLFFATLMASVCLSTRADVVSSSNASNEIESATPPSKILTVVFYYCDDNADGTASDIQLSYDRLVATLRRYDSPMLAFSPYEHGDQLATVANFNALLVALKDGGDLSAITPDGVNVEELEELRFILCGDLYKLGGGRDDKKRDAEAILHSTYGDLRAVGENERWKRALFFIDSIESSRQARGVISPNGRDIATLVLPDENEERADGSENSIGNSLTSKIGRARFRFVAPAFFFDVLEEAFSRVRSHNGYDSFISAFDALNHVEKMFRETGDYEKRFYSSIEYPRGDWRLGARGVEKVAIGKKLMRDLCSQTTLVESIFLPEDEQIQFFQTRLRAQGADVTKWSVRREDAFSKPIRLPNGTDASTLTITGFVLKPLVDPKTRKETQRVFLIVVTESGDRYLLSANQLEDEKPIAQPVSNVKSNGVPRPVVYW